MTVPISTAWPLEVCKTLPKCYTSNDSHYFLQDHNVNLQEGRDQFLREIVANTSIYIGKAIIVNLLDSKSLSNFASNASTSEFKCKVQ